MFLISHTHNDDSRFDPEQDRDLVIAINEARTPAEVDRVVRIAHQRLAARARRDRPVRRYFARRRHAHSLRFS